MQLQPTPDPNLPYPTTIPLPPTLLDPDQLTTLLVYLLNKYGYQSTQLRPKNTLLITTSKEEVSHTPRVTPYSLYNQIQGSRYEHNPKIWPPHRDKLPPQSIQQKVDYGLEPLPPQPTRTREEKQAESRTLSIPQVETLWKRVIENEALRRDPLTKHRYNRQLLKELATELGASYVTISNIVSGRSYKDMTAAILRKTH